jgi:hypothetical protein
VLSGPNVRRMPSGAACHGTNTHAREERFVRA